MALDIPLRCACGAIRGQVDGVTPSNARRLSCMCRDCQAFAHYLGCADSLLDAYGGTDISYATPRQVKLHTGIEQLRCVRLSAEGLLRWYAGCCRTPIANTLPARRIAFVALPHLALDCAALGQPRDSVLGPLTRRFEAGSARSTPPAGAHQGTPFAAKASFLAVLLRDSLIGRAQPTPFLDERTRQPVVEPMVLDAATRAALGATH
ncbi:MAG: DUF6151 family protein [Myxococcales bacterium]